MDHPQDLADDGEAPPPQQQQQQQQEVRVDVSSPMMAAVVIKKSFGNPPPPGENTTTENNHTTPPSNSETAEDDNYSSMANEIIIEPSQQLCRPKRSVHAPFHYYKDDNEKDDQEQDDDDDDDDDEEEHGPDEDWKEEAPKLTTKMTHLRKRRRTASNDDEDEDEDDDRWCESSSSSSRRSDRDNNTTIDDDDDDDDEEETPTILPQSEYEAKRLERVQRNNERLAQLGLLENKRIIIISKPPKRQRPTVAAVPTRSSAPRSSRNTSIQYTEGPLPSMSNDEVSSSSVEEEEEEEEEGSSLEEEQGEVECNQKEPNTIVPDDDFTPQIGLRIQKDFDGILYQGRVTRGPYKLKLPNGQTSLEWRVEFDDGDEEDMNQQELYECLIVKEEDNNKQEPPNDFEPTIGLCIEKDFGGVLYQGTVTHGPFALSEDDNQNDNNNQQQELVYWNVRYDDGDQEDLNRLELYKYKKL